MKQDMEPDNTAVRTALWRALHLEVDGVPFILEDRIGLQMIAPNEEWRQRPDMHPSFTKRLRASIVARARFIEDLVTDESKRGVGQYVILGAGLDTFAQRKVEIASQLQIYEIDQPGTLAWKRARLAGLGYELPAWLHFVAVDFETTSWWEGLIDAGFDLQQSAVVVCTGVSLYLTRAAIEDTLRRMAGLAPGSTVAMTFYLPMDLLEEEDKFLQQIAEKGAREAGTPFVSFFTPEEMLALGHAAGFREVRLTSTKNMEADYFRGRSDGLVPASGEIFLVAKT